MSTKAMKKLLITLTAGLCSLITMAQELPLKKEAVFQEGEVLQYKLRYGFITAAEATIKVTNSDLKFDNRSTYKLTVDAQTSGTFDVF